MTAIQDHIFGMSGAAREVMRCLFFHGPTWDGDVPSKVGRGELVRLGYAEWGNGLQWLTAKGVEFAVQSLMLDRQKDKWQDERSRAVHAMRKLESLDNADWTMFRRVARKYERELKRIRDATALSADRLREIAALAVKPIKKK